MEGELFRPMVRSTSMTSSPLTDKHTNFLLPRKSGPCILDSSYFSLSIYSFITSMWGLVLDSILLSLFVLLSWSHFSYWSTKLCFLSSKSHTLYIHLSNAYSAIACYVCITPTGHVYIVLQLTTLVSCLVILMNDVTWEYLLRNKKLCCLDIRATFYDMKGSFETVKNNFPAVFWLTWWVLLEVWKAPSQPALWPGRT